jgi:hypothetical protein
MKPYNLPNGRQFTTEAELAAYQQGLVDGTDKAKRLITDIVHTTVKQSVAGDLQQIDAAVLQRRMENAAKAAAIPQPEPTPEPQPGHVE